jgi:hypothetical protein
VNSLKNFRKKQVPPEMKRTRILRAETPPGRLRIIKKVGELLADEKWLAESARKLSRNNFLLQEDNRRRLQSMLEDIRDTLRAVDPLLEDIDRRNMPYARSSAERVKTLLEPDSTLAGNRDLADGEGEASEPEEPAADG